MTHVYDILNTLRDELLTNPSVNTVTVGEISDVDLDKTTIFPLSHLIISDVTYKPQTVVFTIKLLCSDIVDYSNEPTKFDQFYGDDNIQDVMNTQFEVINSLIMKLVRGNLFEFNYQINSEPTATPFKDRFSNVLAGWETDIAIEMPNNISIC